LFVLIFKPTKKGQSVAMEIVTFEMQYMFVFGYHFNVEDEQIMNNSLVAFFQLPTLYFFVFSL
jgi:hypoxanthine-guanine phosphoribosyltransferase